MVKVELGPGYEHGGQRQRGPHAALEVRRQQLGVMSHVCHVLVERAERPAVVDLDGIWLRGRITKVGCE